MSKILNDDEIDWTSCEDAPGKPSKPPKLDTGPGCSLSGCVICILISAAAWLLVYGLWQVVEDVLTVAGVI